MKRLRKIGLFTLPLLATSCFAGAVSVWWTMPLFRKVPDQPMYDWVAIGGYVFMGLVVLVFWYDLFPHRQARIQARKEAAQRRFAHWRQGTLIQRKGDISPKTNIRTGAWVGFLAILLFAVMITLAVLFLAISALLFRYLPTPPPHSSYAETLAFYGLIIATVLITPVLWYLVRDAWKELRQAERFIRRIEAEYKEDIP